MKLFTLVVFACLALLPAGARALEITTTEHEMSGEEDAPNRTLADYIADFVDVPPGAIDWKVFGATKEIPAREPNGPNGFDYEYFKPEFTKDVKALDGKTIRVKGFIFPLDPTDDQSNFLFGPFPLNCPFQYHVGPSLVMEAKVAKKPIPFSYEAVILEGRLELVEKDFEYSTFYRLHDVKLIK